MNLWFFRFSGLGLKARGRHNPEAILMVPGTFYDMGVSRSRGTPSPRHYNTGTPLPPSSRKQPRSSWKLEAPRPCTNRRDRPAAPYRSVHGRAWPSLVAFSERRMDSGIAKTPPPPRLLETFPTPEFWGLRKADSSI